MTKKSNTHPHLQSTTDGLPRMRTHPKTYQKCPETFLFDVSSPVSPICRVCASALVWFWIENKGVTNPRTPLQDWGSQTPGSQTPGSWVSKKGVGGSGRGTQFPGATGATAGSAKHFTELPDCPSELSLGWWCTRLVLGHPNALGRCCFFCHPDVPSEWST